VGSGVQNDHLAKLIARDRSHSLRSANVGRIGSCRALHLDSDEGTGRGLDNKVDFDLVFVPTVKEAHAVGHQRPNIEAANGHQ
jgi:hypothetical protein